MPDILGQVQTDRLVKSKFKKRKKTIDPTLKSYRQKFALITVTPDKKRKFSRKKKSVAPAIEA